MIMAYPEMLLQGLKICIQYLSQESRYPYRDSNK
jgi:hypothetical protein